METAIRFLKRFAWPFPLAFGISAALDRTTPEYEIDKSFFHLVVLLLAATILTLINFKIDRPKQAVRVRKFIPSRNLLILDSDDKLHNGMMAMVYHDDGEVQLEIGRGEVETVTEAGRIQLKVDFLDSLDQDIQTGLIENKKRVLGSLVVVPGIRYV